MQMHLATKTLETIAKAMYEDQGAKYRGHLKNLMPLAGDAYSTSEEPFRNHLGASLIGRECARELWYTFHWATLVKFDARILRLFNRGHLEEPRMLALLLTIGCEVWQLDENGKQFRIQGHRGHFGGSLDGVANGIPDLLGIPFLTEFKTHNDKSFAKVAATGVIAAKWEHFVQMQIYMDYYGLTHGLYCAVNKNNDHIHMEIVQHDLFQAKKYRDRAAMIIDSETLPPRISESPGWFKCKFCDHKPICHGKDLPATNCRTCTYSEIKDEGKWICTHPIASKIGDSEILTPEEQRMTDCGFYIIKQEFYLK